MMLWKRYKIPINESNDVPLGSSEVSMNSKRERERKRGRENNFTHTEKQNKIEEKQTKE